LLRRLGRKRIKRKGEEEKKRDERGKLRRGRGMIDLCAMVGTGVGTDLEALIEDGRKDGGTIIRTMMRGDLQDVLLLES